MPGGGRLPAQTPGLVSSAVAAAQLSGGCEREGEAVQGVCALKSLSGQWRGSPCSQSTPVCRGSRLLRERTVGACPRASLRRGLPLVLVFCSGVQTQRSHAGRGPSAGRPVGRDGGAGAPAGGGGVVCGRAEGGSSDFGARPAPLCCRREWRCCPVTVNADAGARGRHPLWLKTWRCRLSPHQGLDISGRDKCQRLPIFLQVSGRV